MQFFLRKLLENKAATLNQLLNFLSGSFVLKVKLMKMKKNQDKKLPKKVHGVKRSINNDGGMLSGEG